MATPPSTHMDDIIIRAATETDADTIGELWQKLVMHHREIDERLPLPSDEGAKLYARRVCERVGDTHMHVIVAEHDGKVVGFVLGMIVDLVPEMFQPRMGGFLADIYLDEQHRKQGIGKAMVDALITWFRSRGVQYLEWYVASANHDGRAFWNKLGGKDIMTRMRLDL